MPDIDYTVDIGSGFSVSLEDNPKKATGNKALANRFEITFLTSTKKYLLGESEVVTDGYGGNADSVVGQMHALNNEQSIAASVTVAIDKTVESIIQNQETITEANERLVSASLTSLDIRGDTVYAKIELVPEEYEEYYPLYYSLPIRGI